MFDFIKTFFRKRSLRKHSSTVPTEILPLGKIRSYVAIIDVEEQSFDTCKTAIMTFFRSHNIKGSVFFQDFRKIGSEDRLITSIQTTITKKDLDRKTFPLQTERAGGTGSRPFHLAYQES